MAIKTYRKHDPVEDPSDKRNDCGNPCGDARERASGVATQERGQEADKGEETCDWVQDGGARKAIHCSCSVIVTPRGRLDTAKNAAHGTVH